MPWLVPCLGEVRSVVMPKIQIRKWTSGGGQPFPATTVALSVQGNPLLIVYSAITK